MTTSLYDNYLNKVRQRMEYRRFIELDQELPTLSPSNTFHRRAFVLTKFGLVDTLCVMKHIEQSITIEYVQQFSNAVFQATLQRKVSVPRGLGSMAIAYPVLVTQGVSEKTRLFIREYSPKHWAAVELPIIVDLEGGHLHYFSKTPLWGAAYYRGFRKEVSTLFAVE